MRLGTRAVWWRRGEALNRRDRKVRHEVAEKGNFCSGLGLLLLFFASSVFSLRPLRLNAFRDPLNARPPYARHYRRGVERQKAVPLVYEAVKMECGFRADLVVEGRVVVELKCKEVLHPVDQAQLLSHLRLLDVPVGLLINFHVVFLKEGIKRVVNDYREAEEESS